MRSAQLGKPNRTPIEVMPLYHCKHQPCAALLQQRGYCTKHTDKDTSKAEKAARDAVYDKESRDADARKFYASKQWQETRALHLAQNPFCAYCLKAFASHVHHIEPLRQNWSKALDRTNLESLCPSCHTRHENRERARL